MAQSKGDDPHEPPAEAPAKPTYAEPTDAELLQAHVDGDAGAFATLVARHQDRLWAVALGVMRNPADAADALQEAYISAFRRASSFRGHSRVTTWLHRIVVNACLDRLRSLKVRAAEALPDDLDRSPGLGTEPADPVEAEQERAQILAALGRLNADQRAALVLVDMQGYSIEEAAAILGCAPGTVKSRSPAAGHGWRPCWPSSSSRRRAADGHPSSPYPSTTWRPSGRPPPWPCWRSLDPVRGDTCRATAG